MWEFELLNSEKNFIEVLRFVTFVAGILLIQSSQSSSSSSNFWHLLLVIIIMSITIIIAIIITRFTIKTHIF